MTTGNSLLSVEVALLPEMAGPVDSKTCVVIDVLRAATSLAFMAQTGVKEVTIVRNPQAARQLAQRIGSNALLCGESDGLKPDDFDFGNSPRAYCDPSILGQQVIFCSSNGARALHMFATSPLLVFAALVNAAAVARIALDAWREDGQGLCIVCSGNDHGRSASLDDIFCAGLIIDHLLSLLPSGQVVLDDSSNVALRVYRGYLHATALPGDVVLNAATRMFDDSSAARKLRGWGFVDDVAACGEVDRVPEVMQVVQEDGLLVARPIIARA